MTKFWLNIWHHRAQNVLNIIQNWLILFTLLWSEIYAMLWTWGRRTTCGSHFSPSTKGSPGIKLKVSGLSAGVFFQAPDSKTPSMFPWQQKTQTAQFLTQDGLVWCNSRHGVKWARCVPEPSRSETGQRNSAHHKHWDCHPLALKFKCVHYAFKIFYCCQLFHKLHVQLCDSQWGCDSQYMKLGFK